MCGITGWADFEEDLSGQQPVVAAMTATMACRGPDAAGTWCSERALIGHRRLAVVDIPGGVQPAADRGVVLTFSGEIYNFRELRRELEGYGHEWLTEYKISLVWANRPLDGRDIAGELHTDFASALPSAGLRRTMYQKR